MIFKDSLDSPFMAFAYIDCSLSLSLSLSLSPKKKMEFRIHHFLGPTKKWNHHFLGPTPTARWQKWWVHSPRQDSPWLHNRSWSYHKHGTPTKHPSRNPIKHNVPLNNLMMKPEKKNWKSWELEPHLKKIMHPTLCLSFVVNQLEGVSSRFIWRPVTLLLQIWQHCLTNLRLKGGNYSTLKLRILIASCRSFCADCPKHVHHPSHLKNALLIRRCSIRFS